MTTTNKRTFVERAAIVLAAQPFYEEQQDVNRDYYTVATTRTAKRAVEDALALWDEIEKTLTE